jgi:acyl-CoA synthetase (AMP-forming)/AMP-acid ligase II
MDLRTLVTLAARRHRTRTAVVDEGRRFTFAETQERVNRLANGLDRLGLRKGDRVASLQFNSHETIEVDLACVVGGLARVLLNARAAVDDHAYVINDCGARALVFGPEFSGLVEELRGTLPAVEHFIATRGPGPGSVEYEDLLEKSSRDEPGVTVDGEDLHSLYYTSGTTGRPKGVMLSRRNWLALVRNHLIDIFHPLVEDVLLHAAPMSHASGAFVIAHWVRGIPQVILPRWDDAACLAAIDRERVATVFLAPTMVIRLLNHPDLPRRDVSSLRNVVYGGAPMPVERLKEALDRFGPVFRQGYGLWEAPQLITTLAQEEHATGGDPRQLARLASAGRPLTFTEVRVVDEADRPVAPGERGEIVSRGDHVMLGYWQRPDATAEVLKGGWLHTGDVATVDEDGYIYIVDRKKEMIISGGSNIYPREVEEVLCTHPAVLEAAVIGIPDDTWGETVRAVVTLRPGCAATEAEILAWCRDRMAGYKRPRSAEFVTELPKSAYGKILRREVRDRYWHGRSRRV